MATCLAAFEPYPATKGYGSLSNPWQPAGSDAAFHQQAGVVKPYPTGIWVPESLACDYLPPGVTRVLSVTDRCPYSMRLRSDWAVRDFVFVKEIGTGNASTVWYAFCKKTSAPLAIKTYKKRKLSPLNRCQVAREINIHSQLDHPNVIALYAAFEDNDKVYLLQEYAEGGDLFDEMKRTMGRMPENQLVTAVLLPMMSALLAMHSVGFIHRDIKPENTLFAAGRVLKLADFGLAVNHLVERPVTRLGTLDYMAPEVLVCPDKHLSGDNKERSDLWYTPAVDAWALGVLAYELAVGRPPFGMSTRDETIRAIRQCPPSFPDFMSPGLVDYITHALIKPADQRSSLADLMKHPWIMEHARRAGMEAQVLAYLRLHKPAESQLLASATAAATAAAPQQQQQQPAVAAAPAAQQQQEQLRMQHNPSAAAAAADMSAVTAVDRKAAVTDATVVTSPDVSAALPYGSAAATAAAASPAAAAACYLAGLVAPEPQLLSVLNPQLNDLAAAAAASGGTPRIKKTAKRTGMPRCFSSKSIPGLSGLTAMGSGHQPGLPHGLGHIHWHANGEALALHVPGLLLDMAGSGSDSPRSNSPTNNSSLAAAASVTGGRGMARAASMVPLHLQQQQQLQDGYNPLLGGFGGLLPGLASIHAAAAASLQQQQGSLLPGSPTRRGLTAARLNTGSTGSGSSIKQSSSKRCTPEPDTDLAAALLSLGNNSPSSVMSTAGVDMLSPQLLQQQQQQLLMQQYLRQQQQQMQPGSAAPAAYCQVHGCFVSPNASPKPMSRLGASGLSSSSSLAAAAAAGGIGVSSGVHALLGQQQQQQQQQQQGQYGMQGSCTCGVGNCDSYTSAAGSGACSSSGRSSGTKYSPCSPVLKLLSQHNHFESPLKRVNSQGTLTCSSSSSMMAAPQLAPQLSLPLMQQQQQQSAGASRLGAADGIGHMQQETAAAARRSSTTTPSPTAAAGSSQQRGRPTGSVAGGYEGLQSSATHSSPVGLHMQELADVLSSPGSVGNLLHEHQQQQLQREIQQQQQQQLINHKISSMRHPVPRACSAPSLLHPALQLQLLQYQQQQQVMGWHDGIAGASSTNQLPGSSMAAAAAATAADLYTSEQLQFVAHQQQQQQQQSMGTSPFACVGGLAGMDCTVPASPNAAAAAAAAGLARVNSIGSSLSDQQQQQQFCRSLSSTSALNHPGQLSGQLSENLNSQLNGRYNSQSNSQLPPFSNTLASAALYRANSPGLALLQQQQLAHTAAGWDPAAAAAAAYGAVAAVAAANADVSPLQQSAAAAAGLDMCQSLPSPSSRGLSRSHSSLLSEMGPLQTVPESSAATYEQVPTLQQQQQQCNGSWQQQQQQCNGSWQQQQQLQDQQQLQEIAGALILQQQQQQVQALQQQQQQALKQLQMFATSAALGTAATAADVYQLAAMACSQGATALNPAGSSSPLNPRLLLRHAPSRLAQVSAPLTQQQQQAAAAAAEKL